MQASLTPQMQLPEAGKPIAAYVQIKPALRVHG